MSKYHSQFLLDLEKNAPTAKLRYRIKWNGNIVAFNLGYRVEVNKWSKETQRCKTNTTHGVKKIPASVINKKINEYETACEKIFLKYYYQDSTPNQNEFRELFNVEIGKKTKELSIPHKTFFEIYDLFVKEESKINQWTVSTEIKMKTLKSHLYSFDSNLSFEKLNEQKLLDYQYYLQERKKFKNSTILKNFSFLKWFLNWSKKKRFNNNYAYELFKPKLKTVQKKIIFLTQNELKQIKEYIIPEDKKYLEKVRDVFLFQCFTGLRYSDVANLKSSDVKETFIEITTVKTSDSLIIELNNQSKAILKKYEKNQYDNKALPVISNQRMNEYLRELAELAKINELVRETFFIGNLRKEIILPKYALLSSHAGRRTFICNALSLGIPPQVVMKWTGHSDYKAMKPYIDIADEIKINAMEKFNLL